MNDLQVTRTPEMVAAEINLIKDQTRKLVLSNSILIGKKLKEVKEMLEPGQFGKWLAEAVDFSQSTANNLMVYMMNTALIRVYCLAVLPKATW